MSTPCDYDGYTEDQRGQEHYWHCEDPATTIMRAIKPLRGEGEYRVCDEHADQMLETGEYEITTPDPDDISCSELDQTGEDSQR